MPGGLICGMRFISFWISWRFLWFFPLFFGCCKWWIWKHL